MGAAQGRDQDAAMSPQCSHDVKLDGSAYGWAKKKVLRVIGREVVVTVRFNSPASGRIDICRGSSNNSQETVYASVAAAQSKIADRNGPIDRHRSALIGERYSEFVDQLLRRLLHR